VTAFEAAPLIKPPALRGVSDSSCVCLHQSESLPVRRRLPESADV